MARKLRFESLDARLCFAFGDVDPDFAQAGEHSVSYAALDRSSSSVGNMFTLPDGYLVVANTPSGSGMIATIAKFDFHGAPDPQFGTNGIVQLIDPAVPKSGLSHAMELSDGRLLLRSSTPTAYTSYYVLKSDGSLDTSFAENGFLRTGEKQVIDFAIAADNTGGFLTLESTAQTFHAVLRHYSSDGVFDTNFVQNDSTLIKRMTGSQLTVDSAGAITVVGYDTLDNLRLKSYRFHADGALDTTFGNNGIGTGPPLSMQRFVLDNDGQTFTVFYNASTDTEVIFELRRFTADARPDVTFGDQGVVRVTYGPRTATNYINLNLQLESDGTYRLAIDDITYISRQTTISVIRLLADGSIDLNFGTSGRTQHTFSQVINFTRVLSDGSGGLFWFGYVQPVNNANYISDTNMVRTDADGLLDTNWDGDGVLPLLFTPTSQTIEWMQLDSLGQGKMRLLSGWPTYDAPQPSLGLAQTLDADGQLLSTAPFGRTELKFHTVSSSSADGGWFLAQLMGGPSDHRIEVSKFSSLGVLDSSFGTAGVMTIFTEDLWDIAMRTSRDGSVVIAGSTIDDQADPATSLGVAVIVRLNADGTLVQSFGAGGIQRIYSKPGNLADVLVDPNLGVVLVYDPYFDAGVVMHRYTETGTLDTRFDTTGIAPWLDWRATEVDETGRILLVTDGRYTGAQYQLHQIGTDGKLVSGFGTGGHVDLPISVHGELDTVGLSVRRGVISIAAAHTREATVARLLAYDYAGQPWTELDGDGVRDYDLTPDGEQVADLQFSDDGSLWLATLNREKFDLYGKVIKLEASTAPTIHNWDRPLDVTLDRQVTPFDALIVIGVLNGLAAPTGMFPDTNADTRITALDALLIINYLNSRPAGEGEAPAAVSSPSNAAVVAERASVQTSQLPAFDAYDDIESTLKRRRR